MIGVFDVGLVDCERYKLGGLVRSLQEKYPRDMSVL